MELGDPVPDQPTGVVVAYRSSGGLLMAATSAISHFRFRSSGVSMAITLQAARYRRGPDG